MNLSISLSLGSTRAGPQGPTIVISASSIAENAVVGSTVGVLSVVNGTGTWTFTKTADPDAKFVLAGTGGANLNTAAGFDFETAQSHSVTIEATNGTETISRTFSIGVLDVAEGGVTPLDPQAFTLGWNDGFSAYWGTGDQYNDLSSRSAWVYNAPGVNAQVIPANETTTSGSFINRPEMGFDGYPTAVPATGELRLVIPLNPVPASRAGVYNVTVDEVGPVLAGAGGEWANTLVWNAATGTGTMTVDTSNPTNGQHIRLVSMGGASKCKIRIKPSFSPDRMLSPLQESDWAPFQIMRHMTNQKINRRFAWDSGIRTTPLTLAQRNSGHHADFGTGFSVEMAVAASNELMKHLWWCSPHDADADYMQYEAEYIRANLNPALSCLIEYSNEIWNPQFEQTTNVAKNGLLNRFGQVNPANTSLPVPTSLSQIKDAGSSTTVNNGDFIFAHFKLYQARANLPTGTVPDNVTTDTANFLYLQDANDAMARQYGLKASEMATIYETAFAGQRNRLIVVCADQTGSSEARKTMRLTTGDFHTKVNMYACAYYFGDGVGGYPRLGRWAETTVNKALLGVDNEAFKDDYFAKAAQSIDAVLAQIDADQAAITAILAARGRPSIPVGNYEWGNHTTWSSEWVTNYPDFNTVRDQIWNDPRNGQMYALLAQGFAARGGIHVGFDMVGGLGNSSFGITQVTGGQSDGRWAALNTFAQQLNPTAVPSNNVLPTISGVAQVGETLVGTNGVWTNLPTSYTKSWTRNGSPIAGATGSTYTLVTADVGAVIRHVVIANNAIGASSPATSAGTAAVLPAPPSAFIDTFDVTGWITDDTNYTLSGGAGLALRKSGGNLISDRSRTSDANTWMLREIGSAGGQRLIVDYDYSNGGSTHSNREYAFRAIDSANHFFVQIDSISAGSTIKVRKRVGGVDTFISATSGITWATTGVIRVDITSADVCTVYYNGTLVGTFNLASHVSSAAGALSGTKTGIRSITRGPPDFPAYIIATRFETVAI